jgi:hypothetical protein
MGIAAAVAAFAPAGTADVAQGRIATAGVGYTRVDPSLRWEYKVGPELGVRALASSLRQESS